MVVHDACNVDSAVTLLQVPIGFLNRFPFCGVTGSVDSRNTLVLQIAPLESNYWQPHLLGLYTVVGWFALGVINSDPFLDRTMVEPAGNHMCTVCLIKLHHVQRREGHSRKNLQAGEEKTSQKTMLYFSMFLDTIQA